MEADDDTNELLISNTPEQHKIFFHIDSIEYLAIINDVSDQLLGFFIRAFEPNNSAVEFRRIVIAEKGKGYGQKAIRTMEKYCIETHNTKNIWLDVFEFNKRGQHIYNKLGYQCVRSESYEGKTLKIYEKNLQFMSGMPT